ncbi:MAG: phosphatidylserine synthase [Flavobacteriales bacterium]|jgi:phosphatidylserine synthase
MTVDNPESRGLQPSILSYVKDLPNICSLAGLACTLLSIYFSILGIYHAAMIGMIWAVAFDWADGLVARRMKNRTGSDRAFGAQIDLLIDIVSYGVAPSVFLLSYGDFGLVFLAVAFLMLAASAIRLSYFSTFGLADGAKYTGLALDNNNIILVFIFLLEALFGHVLFSYVLCVCCVSLAVLNVSQIKTPKLSGTGRNVYLLAFYTVGITALYAWKLLGT